MKLTIGMACFDDFNGVYFTIQSLRILRALELKEIEFVVIDNNPESPEGKMTHDFIAGWVPEGRYIAAPDVVGTSAPRDRVFREATGEIVLCIDAHVLLWPGAVQSLRDFFAAHPNSRDLISGPMMYDDGIGFTTHFQDEWRAEMWGTWDRAWQCRCGRFRFSVAGGAKALNAPPICLYQPIFGERNGKQFLAACPDCGATFPDLTYHGHEAALRAAGFTDEIREPFDIPAMGLGLFACRKDAWLGFNPNFRGFGGEEFYIHEKYRRAGAKAICLPQLKWTHRFGRPGGVKYPLTRWNKVRNYVIGHRENDLPLDRLKQHFVGGGLTSQSEWDALLAADPPPFDPPGQPPVPGCNSCNSDFMSKAATLDEVFQRAATAPSDINEHCSTLRDLASQCQHVTEFGVRHGVSTTALLAGRPAKLVSYDINRYPEVPHLERLALLRPNGDSTSRPGEIIVSAAPEPEQIGTYTPIDFRFVQGSSLDVDIEPTDLLFIDTKHTADQLYAELTRHAPQVRRWIVMHDTTIFGERGEDGGPGLLPALRRFLREQPEWTVKLHHGNNNGLTVITRDPADKKPLPSGLRMALNFAGALASHVTTGAKDATKEDFEQRLEICSLCDQRNEDRCGVCGCPIADKAKWKEQECPLGKWPAPTAETSEPPAA